MRFLPTIAAAAAACLLAAAPGSAASRSGPVTGAKAGLGRSPDLWATINVCDTEAHPNTIGIRGSMPGLGKRRAALWMRFQVQYRARADDRWHNLDETAGSVWKRIGVTRNRVFESGQNFQLLPPPGGGSHMLRGVVRFKWVVRGRAVRKLKRVTEAGHRSTAGADPPGFSAATCLIS